MRSSERSNSVTVWAADEDFDALLGDDSTPIYVKVDVEGFEKTVITELMNSKHADRIVEVFYEVDERWVDPKELRGILEKAGFDAFQIEGGGGYYDTLASRKSAAQ